MSLTEGCTEALKEVFHRIDLDGNGCISRMEFDFFQEMTSGESCDDDAWKVIQGQYKTKIITYTCINFHKIKYMYMYNVYRRTILIV